MTVVTVYALLTGEMDGHSPRWWGVDQWGWHSHWTVGCRPEFLLTLQQATESRRVREHTLARKGTITNQPNKHDNKQWWQQQILLYFDLKDLYCHWVGEHSAWQKGLDQRGSPCPLQPISQAVTNSLLCFALCPGLNDSHTTQFSFHSVQMVGRPNNGHTRSWGLFRMWRRGRQPVYGYATSQCPIFYTSEPTFFSSFFRVAYLSSRPLDGGPNRSNFHHHSQSWIPFCLSSILSLSINPIDLLLLSLDARVLKQGSIFDSTVLDSTVL